MIHNEDCLVSMSVMQPGSVDMVLTSPPYDSLRIYNGFSFDFESVSKEITRILKPGGVCVWVVGDQTKNGTESGTSFRQALLFKECGLNIHDTMIYRKSNYVPLTHNRYEQEFEYMFVFSKGKPKTFNPITVQCKTAGTKRSRAKSNKEAGTSVRNRDEVTTTKSHKIKGNIFEYPVSNTKYDHPAIDQINSWTNQGDLVYDPFAGSGTTLVAAKTLKRDFVGSEISANYVEIVNARLLSYE